MSWGYLYTKSPNVTETGDRLLPYGSGTLHLPGLEIDRPETRLKDYSLTLQKYIVELTVGYHGSVRLMKNTSLKHGDITAEVE